MDGTHLEVLVEPTLQPSLTAPKLSSSSRADVPVSPRSTGLGIQHPAPGTRPGLRRMVASWRPVLEPKRKRLSVYYGWGFGRSHRPDSRGGVVEFRYD